MQVGTESSSAQSGSLWVEGSRIHWADGSTEYKASNQGNQVSTGHTGSAGSVWVEGKYFHWIDQNGVERRFYGVDSGEKPGGQGNVWVENGYFNYLDQNGRNRIIK
jgi:hypothetical protein